MCSHQTGENAMNILKINKDVSPMWKNKKKILAQWTGSALGQRLLKPLPRAAKILNYNYFYN